MYKNLKEKKSQGFTIVELLIVIVVIGILAAITIVAYSNVSRNAKVNSVQYSLEQAKRAVVSYKSGSGEEVYPATLADANVKASSGPTLQYSVNNTVNPKTYCITATLNDVSYYISSTDNAVTAGYCPGHSSVVNQTAGGWSSYPIPWSTSTTEHGYGLYYGAYYPSTLRSENSGSLTLFNPLATTASQGGVNTYLWCRNTSTNAINTSITGPTFPTFNASNVVGTVTWNCPAGTVLYALSIGSTNPGGNTPDNLSAAVKARTWFSPQSPNYTAPQPYTMPSVAVDPAGWTSMPLPWGGDTYSDMGYGPYYGVYIANDPAKNLAATQTGTLQLYNPYSSTRAQGGVVLSYWCKNDTTGMVSTNSSVTFATFNATQTREVNWTCAAGSKLFAAAISSTMSSTYYPNEISSKTRFWFSGESVLASPSYLESIRTIHGE